MNAFSKFKIPIPEEVSGHQRYSAMPWHLSVSTGELKPGNLAVDGASQSTAYAGLLNQARPDKLGVYAFAMSPSKYRILWSDASGLASSEDMEWDNILPLISYIYSLYRPRRDHPEFDTSITLVPNDNLALPPRWTVTFQGVIYPNCRVLFVGPMWTRQSWIAVSGGDNPGHVIKDQYHAVGRRFQEGKLFDILQEGLNGKPAPGFVYVQCHGDVPGIHTPIEATRRQRVRMVMSTLGDAITECPTVFQFLKAMYDALEGATLPFL
jgi:hypothetical protein